MISSKDYFEEELGLSELDMHFVRFIAGLTAKDSFGFRLAVSLLSRQTSQGHVCINLEVLAGTYLVGENGVEVQCPRLDEWLFDLECSGVVGAEGDFCPLVVDNGSRLYLHRYWEYERDVADFMLSRTRDIKTGPVLPQVSHEFRNLFPAQEESFPDWQAIAALAAVRKSFCVIAGGPGTGKTTTVAKILALIVEQAAGKPLRIALAAPTGKAASRLQESIRQTKNKYCFKEEVAVLIPEHAFTIHRLLGAVSGSPYFRHDQSHPLPFDVLVVDEASMIDLPLMAKLVNAIPCECRLILLGDRNQLSSVEPGSVFGDICVAEDLQLFSESFARDVKVMNGMIIPGDSAVSPSDVNDSLVELKHSFRFGATSGIALISEAVQAGDVDTVVGVLQGDEYPDVTWREVAGRQQLRAAISDRCRSMVLPEKISESWDFLRRSQVLCALRRGAFGAVSINMMMEGDLLSRREGKTSADFYQGLPLMVTENDYNLRLYNGDVGMVLADEDSGGDLRVFFPGEQGGVRKFSPSVLPGYEKVFAMTVHKSQGSEFDEVLLVLPEKMSLVVTRELIYTALTRARKKVEFWGSLDVLIAGVSRCVSRESGLGVRLRR
ncbi:MAG: exodeoxyribonuclease V subunit alpha [Proteobacteria bacterium]|nr:exodeoxyribonuclease V subunit alpha [Pseudomonadota bacterium]MBU1717208.1 exodeoxyribonuclease V subunit alpha [Pseudomonadota bacterium]